jgi:DNA-binding NtrC family response regulator
MDSTQKANSKQIKVLHVDRDMEFLIVSKQTLHLLGNFEIDLATTILSANKAMKRKHYDVVVSGYRIGKKNGLDFMRELRTKESKMPFIIFSVHREVASQALDLGASAFVEKDGDCERVFAILSNNIKRANRKNEFGKPLADNSLKHAEHFEKELMSEKR